MQGEVYTEAAFGQHGSQEFNVEKLLNERPEYFVFNGSVGAISKLQRSWMFSISPAPAVLAKRASNAFSSATVMFSCLRPKSGDFIYFCSVP
jgi:hypothetical protein